MSGDCVFCKIVKGGIPAEIVKETADFIVFPDIKPSAPVHFLIVPKMHVRDISEMTSEMWSGARALALEIAKERKFLGFRLATNVGDAAAVSHAHIHFLAGIKSERKI